MSDETSRICVDCDVTMSPIVIMDKNYYTIAQLEYRQPDDRRSFWTGKYPTAGQVQAFMCGGCGRIELYGIAPAA